VRNSRLCCRLEDKNNAKEIEALKKQEGSAGDEKESKRKELDALRLVRQQSVDVPDRPKSQLMLLNLLHAPEGSMLHRLATTLTRIEDLSHILAWTATKVQIILARSSHLSHS
jgi:hypothetical protein